MTTPQQPVDQPLPLDPGWDDLRLAAAFAARAARVVVPVDLAAVTVERLQPAAAAGPWWRRLLPVGAAAALLVAVVGGGVVLRGGPSGLLGGGSGITFRDGPSPDLRTLDGGSYELDFPAEWFAYASNGAAATGGSIGAILTTQPVEERCIGLTGVDINCAYEQRLEPGASRIFVGQAGLRAQTVLDRADIENGVTTRVALGGMPAIIDVYDDVPDDYYQADVSVTWQIATPASMSNVVLLEFMAREPDASTARSTAEALAESLRFNPPPTPLPDDPAAAVAAARAMLDAEADSFRRGFVPADDSDGQTYLDCLPEAPGEDRVVGIDYGPGGDLGWTVLTRCRWTVVADDHGPFWRIDTEYEWTVGEQFGRYREPYWIDAAGVVVARTSSGEVPPAGDPSATPGPSSTAVPTPTKAPPAWEPWPPADAFSVIELKEEGGRKPRVAVVDRSGSLTSVSEAVPDPSGGTAREGISGEPSGDGRMRVRWTSSICDVRVVVTIDRDIDRILIEHAPRSGCDAMGIGREIVLEFSRDVDPATIALEVIPAELLPEAISPDVPAELFGLDVVDVDAARAIQARPDDDREIAVRGWIWRMNPATIDCLVFEQTDVEDLFFGEGCRSDSLLATADGTFDDAVVPLAIGQAIGAALPFDTRVEVILIGHFDDRRSSLCSPPLAPRCADMFWVDAVWKDGDLTPRDWFDPVRGRDPATHTHDDAWARVRGPEEDPLIPFSIAQITGSALQRLEPASSGSIPLEPWNWHVTAYEPSSGRLRTFVIPDSVLANFEGVVSYEIVGDEVLITTRIID